MAINFFQKKEDTDNDKKQTRWIVLDKKLTLSKYNTYRNKQKAIAVKQIMNPYNVKTKLSSQQIYRAYNQSILLYAAPAWSVTANAHILKLEILERYCFRQFQEGSKMLITRNYTMNWESLSKGENNQRNQEIVPVVYTGQPPNH